MKKIALFILIIIGIALFLFWKHGQKITPVVTATPKPDNSILRLISTKPDPLEGATILPNGSIGISFNHSITPAEFKHHFDPPIADTVIEDNHPDQGIYTMKITFKKPLELGSGYALYIQADTDSRDGLKLGQDYIYHFSTINYNGV